MPVGVDKIHPFLPAVAASRAVKEVICSQIRLIKEGNEIILHRGLLVHIESELPIHGFEFIT